MRPRFLIHILLIAVFGLIAAGCTYKPDARLLRAESMMADSLPQARAMLDSIDRTSLSEPDRNLRDLLAIKGADKAYVKHTADSAILRVVDYYDRHQSTGRYPEALYYAGRVYSDLGDYPTALEYYHKALDELSDDDSDMDLRGRIAGNLAYILNALRMYEQAIPYAEETLKIFEVSRDTTDMMFSHQQMGLILMHAEKFDGPEYHLNKSLLLAQRNATDNLAACQQMYLAAVKYNKNHIDSALNLIRGVPERITDSYHHTALAYAADIYIQSGIVDTAYMYTMELTRPENRKNWRIAYKKLLFSPLRRYVPSDSIDTYYQRYGEIVEEFVQNNGNEAAILENANYNYNRHVIDRRKAEEKNARLSIMILCLLILILAATVLTLYIQSKRRKQLVELHEAVDHVVVLRENLMKVSKEADQFRAQSEEYKEQAFQYREQVEEYQKIAEDLQRELEETSIDFDGNKITDKQKLVARLRDEIKRLAEDPAELPGLPAGLVESQTYKELLACVKNKKSIANTSSLWKSLTRMVAEYYPNFKTSLSILFDGKLNEYTYRRLMLVKLRLRPSEIAYILALQRGAVSKERGLDCMRIFGTKEGSKYLDRAIILI